MAISRALTRLSLSRRARQFVSLLRRSPRKSRSGDPPGPGRNSERDFHGERHGNDTHVSVTYPDARLYRRGPGKEARLYFMGHALIKNRNGLIIGAVTTRASGYAERLAVLALINCMPSGPPVTLGADNEYDASDFVMALRDRAVTPDVAQNPRIPDFQLREHRGLIQVGMGVGAQYLTRA
jgi:hypothetical protein